MLLVIGVVGTWWWLRDGDAPAAKRMRQADREQQAAVLRDGFAMRALGRVRVLDRKGDQRADHRLDRERDLRIVGTRGGPAAAWIERKTIRLVDVKNGKTAGVWGKAATTLCEGVATNDERFAVGWLEDDGALWFVHGDTRPAGDAVADTTGATVGEPVLATAAAAKQWCGVASAGPNIALFWRDRDRLFINTCTRKKCSGLPAAVGLDHRATVLGFGCVKSGCLLAARDPDGTGRFGFITETGGIKWSKPLDKTVRDVSIVGTSDTAFAFGYATDAGAEVLRVERGGATTRVWRGEHAPVLAWSQGQLLVGHADHHTIVPFPK